MLPIIKRIILGLERRGFLNWIPDKPYLKMMYLVSTDKKLNLSNPQTFNEKLQWLKLYDRKPEYTRMVDKYEVKKYVADKIGDRYIIPTLGVWDNPDDIEFDALPEQFVLKCNHNSGRGMYICKDKSSMNKEQVVSDLRAGLKQNYYIHGREWPYKNVKPRILAEKYMVDESGTELRDYKVMCFDGKPRLIQYHQGRFKYHTQDFYDVDWNKLEIVQGCPPSETVLDRPEFLEEMLELSQILAKDIPQVRVDWYYVQGQLYFGELTFFDGSGFYEFEPDELNEIIGRWFTLPKKLRQAK